MIKLFGAKLKCVKRLELYLVPFGSFKSLYSKLIGWELERMKYVAARGDEVLLLVVLW
jgi:hypothetical protein